MWHQSSCYSIKCDLFFMSDSINVLTNLVPPQKTRITVHLSMNIRHWNYKLKWSSKLTEVKIVLHCMYYLNGIEICALVDTVLYPFYVINNTLCRFFERVGVKFVFIQYIPRKMTDSNMKLLWVTRKNISSSLGSILCSHWLIKVGNEFLK